MMRRLIWKEFREQGPFALAALLAPPAILLFVRVVLKIRDPWPSEVGGLWPLYPLFVAWGATRMPVERDPGRLTLVTMPVPWAPAWALKAIPAIPWAVVCAAFAYAIGNPHPADTRWWWIDAGTMALGFGSAFLSGVFWTVGAGALIGLTAVVGWWTIVDRITWLPSEDAEGIALWALAGSLLVASACVIAARARGARPRRVGVATGGVYLALVVAATVAARPGAPVSAYRHRVWPSPGFASSQSGEFTAQIEGETGHDGSERYRIVVRSMGERTPRWTIKRHGIPVFMFWTPAGDLLFREIVPKTRRDDLMLWNPKTGRLRVALSRPMGPPPRMFYGLDRVAMEPGGSRLALIYTSRPAPLSRVANSELWVVDLRTRRQHLLYPNVDASQLWWRRGRIYVEQSSDQLWSSSPDRGGLRREHYLPPAEEGESQ